MAIFHTYLDDSKDGDQKIISVSAGYFGYAESWKLASKLWDARLKIDNVAFYKTSHCNRLDGPFSVFNDKTKYKEDKGRKAANRLRDDLKKIIDESNIAGTSVGVNLKDFNEVANIPRYSFFYTGNPYRRALEVVMDGTIKDLKKRDRNSAVVFFHDDGDDFNELHDYYKLWKKENPKTGKHAIGFQPMDDETTPGIQMADLIANVTKTNGVNLIQNPNAPNDFKGMQASFYKMSIWDKQFMIDMAENWMRIHGKPEKCINY